MAQSKPFVEGSHAINVLSHALALLESENASLCGAAEGLAAENAKLRELAREAMRLMQADGPDCGLCKHYDECWTNDAMDYSPSGCVICKEARELGIEVDDGETDHM